MSWSYGTRRRCSSLLAAGILLGAGLARAAEGPAAAAKPEAPADYVKEVEAWRLDRTTKLKDENSWLSLIGLFWLDEGENKFGSDPKGKVVLPGDKTLPIPPVAGTLIRKGDAVTLKVEPGVMLQVNDRPTTSFYGEIPMVAGGAGEPTFVRMGTVSFFLIPRGDRMGVRMRDSASPAIKAFHGFDYFPISLPWRVEARFEPSPKGKTIPIANVLGQVSDTPCPGTAVFDWQGKTYRIDAMSGGDDGSLFLVFADQTSGKETYGAGRFLDTPAPKDGKVIVDFNTAYNPPCALTAFATCPLPPAQNKLALRVEAGEKKFGEGHAPLP